MNVAIAVYLAAVNVLAFALFGVDKARAKRGAWRISERALLLIAFLGGALGALVGMLAFRHKTRKWHFRIGVPIALVLTLAVAGSALYLGDYYHADEQAIEAATAQPGSDGVHVRQLEDGSLAFEPPEPTAGMVFYPGAKVQPESYAVLLRQCAREDILCVLVRPPFNLAILDANAADGVAEQFPLVDRWFVAGHSMGGVAAASYVADHPDDVDGIVFLASYTAEDLTGYPGGALSVVGSEDKVLNWKNYEEAQAKLPAGALQVVIAGGNHAGFADYGAQAGDGTASISHAEQQAQTVQAIDDFISATPTR